MFYKFLKVVVFIFLSLSLHLRSEGFIAGTLVKTKNGYVPIEQLKENDLVVSYDFKNATLIEDSIVGISKKRVKKVIQLNINNHLLEVDPDHKFYCPMIKENWIKVKDIPLNHVVLKNASELIKINEIKEIEKEVEVYTLSIKNNHNFFISRECILVHNIAIVAWVIGEGLSWAGAGELLSFLTGIVITYIAKKNGVDTSAYNLFNINKPNPDNWLNHIMKPPKHNFNGMDPETGWKLTEMALVAAIKNKELRDGCEYIVNYATEFGNLVVKGKVVDNIIRVGTAFLQKGS